MSAEDHTFSVGEFAQLLRDQLARVFPTDVWVQGEVRGISRPPSGHVYFDLAEPTTSSGQNPDALVSVVLMRATRRVVNRQIQMAGGGVRIADGVHLRIRGAPDFYPPRGQFQLRMTAIDPAYTLGRLAIAREQLLRQLAADGLLGRNRALPFPAAPLRIGLVTADGSAAAADFLHELERSALAWDVFLAPTPVQGDGAPERIAASIAACEARGVEVIAVVRGGGARTDLVAFDHEQVARAVACASVPVITGIGHEIDVSVADEVAHAAFKTPTACAAHLVELVASGLRRADETWREIRSRACDRIDRLDDRVAHLSTDLSRSALDALAEATRAASSSAQAARASALRQLVRQDSALERTAVALRMHSTHRLDSAGAAVAGSSAALRRLARHHLRGASEQIDHAEERRRLLDPATLLARGWSITRTYDGLLVRSRADVEPGVALVTRVADGEITSTVVGGGSAPTSGNKR